MAILPHCRGQAEPGESGDSQFWSNTPSFTEMWCYLKICTHIAPVAGLRGLHPTHSLVHTLLPPALEAIRIFSTRSTYDDLAAALRNWAPTWRKQIRKQRRVPIIRDETFLNDCKEAVRSSWCAKNNGDKTETNMAINTYVCTNRKLKRQ